MTVEEIEKNVVEKMENIVHTYVEVIKKIQVGKLDTETFSCINISTDNQKQQLRRLASITIIDFDTIEIKPWDDSIIQDIYKGVESAKKELSLNYVPNIDKKRILLKFDMVVTKETRKNLVDLCGKKTEEFKIIIRNIRHETLGKIKEIIKNNEEFKKNEKKIQVQFDKYNKLLEEKLKSKVSILLGE